VVRLCWQVDAIGGRRFSEGTSADREIQRTLMELLNQLDGFDVLGKVKMIMATNRPGTRLHQSGRLRFNIEPCDSPNEPHVGPPGGISSAFNRRSPIEPSLKRLVHTRPEE